MYCPKCGTQVRDDVAFCTECGTKLPSSSPRDEAAAPPQKFCSNCGAELSAADKHCWRCGARSPARRAPLASLADRPPAIGYAAFGVAGVLLLLLVGGTIWGVSTQVLSNRRERALADLYRQAADHNSRQAWSQAIAALLDLKTQDPTYQPSDVDDLLFIAYTGNARDLADAGRYDAALGQYDAALKVHPDVTISQERELASLYPVGLAALDRGECGRAEETLRQVYAQDEAYQQVADKLYAACVCLCRDLTGQGKLAEAAAQCQAALDIKPGGTEAVNARDVLNQALTPAPTATPVPTIAPTATPVPTAAPTSTPSPIPMPAKIAPSSTPSAVASATPAKPAATRKPAAPKCRTAAKGMIGFTRANRCDKKTGAACPPYEIWVMNADGSGQAPMCNTKAYQWGIARDHTSNDGTWDVRVSPKKADIMRLYLQTGQQEMIIANNAKDWDPVLSADNWWVAWCTNRNGNDEIFIKSLDPNDQNQRRLTINNWEWDKHPTWSPNGRSIASYSNRADKLSEATRQIWVMDIVNDQGTNLRNLSNSPDKVDYDPVWFKWDGIPK